MRDPLMGIDWSDELVGREVIPDAPHQVNPLGDRLMLYPFDHGGELGVIVKGPAGRAATRLNKAGVLWLRDQLSDFLNSQS